MAQFQFVHCDNGLGRPSAKLQSRSDLNRHVMLNYIAKSRARQRAARNRRPGDPDSALDDDESALAPVPPPETTMPRAHPFDALLQDLGIAALPTVERLYKWQDMTDVDRARSGDWVAQADHIWSEHLWHLSLSDPVTFYTYVQVVLNKVACVTGQSQDEGIHRAAARSLPMLRERIEIHGGCHGTEAYSVSGLVYMSVRLGNYDTARMHLAGLQLLLNKTEPDLHLWCCCYLLDIRLAGVMCCHPFLRKKFYESQWPVQATMNQSQTKNVRRRTARALQSFGRCLEPLSQSFQSCFEQLLSCDLIQGTGSYTAAQQTRGLYSLSYDVCILHGNVCEDLQQVPEKQAMMLELVVITMKLCAWTLSRHIGPQSGEVSYSILARAADILNSNLLGEAGFMGLVDSSQVGKQMALWIIFVQYAEAELHWPDAVDLWASLLKVITAELGLKTSFELTRLLKRFPCVELLYRKRLGLACTQVFPHSRSQWRPAGDSQLSTTKNPLRGFISALHFDFGEEDH